MPWLPTKRTLRRFFDTATLATVLNGKTFDSDKEHEAAGKYGKTIFATRVVEPNADRIDFAGFSSLLDRIVAVLDHHMGLRAVSVAAFA
jgi:RNA-directed DNA polymerase